ncbi:MAG: UDP-N-acetylmuramate dehydrogenase [Treponema sp.]
MLVKEIIEKYPLYNEIKENFKFDEVLAHYTSFKIGGKAEVLYFPKTYDELKDFCNFLIKENISISIIGNASNLLVSDQGIKGVVVSLFYFQTLEIYEKKDDVILVKVDAGVTIEKLLCFCIDNELTGIENFAGLPASIGGAIFMNAKCFDSSFSDLVFSVFSIKMEKQGCKLEKYTFNEKDWAYKISPFQKNSDGIKVLENREVIISSILALKKGKKEDIKQKAEAIYVQRVQKKQFDFPSAGSVFKNDYTIGIPTGKLVSEAGLLGASKGGAEIAPWHGNFIINRGGASANDVIYLMQIVRQEIKNRYGILLEAEIIYCS